MPCLDLGPTLLGLAGIDYPDDAFHGADLSGALCSKVTIQE